MVSQDQTSKIYYFACTLYTFKQTTQSKVKIQPQSRKLKGPTEKFKIQKFDFWEHKSSMNICTREFYSDALYLVEKSLWKEN